MKPRIPKDKPRDLSNPLEELVLQVSEEFEGKRLDKFLAEVLFWRSRTSIQKLIDEGRIFLLNPERKPRQSTRLKKGNIIKIIVPRKRNEEELRENLSKLKTNIEILYEDEAILAVNKPPNMPVHPSGRHIENTLITIIHKIYSEEIQKGIIAPRLCHRLDKETSGVVLLTKKENIRHLMGKQFEKRKVKKTYLAIVQGKLHNKKGVIDLPLAPDPKSKVKMRIRARTDGKGIPALTKYKVLKTTDSFSLLEVTPITGRQHQIRVHLSAIGHPIVGDKLYGPNEMYFLDALEGNLKKEAMDDLILPRHALHAWKIRFTHPLENKEMEIEAPMPEDMSNLINEF